MPAIMAESVFITNTDEGKLLLDEDKLLLPSGTEGRKDQIARRIKAGVEYYFVINSTPTT